MPRNTLESIRKDLNGLANAKKAKILQGFFKTGPGQYGEGDVFLGVTVPDSRTVAKKYKHAALPEIKELLGSSVHEERLVSLLLLVAKYNNASSNKEEGEIVRFYLDNIRRVNNWDLVDLSAPSILGSFLLERDRSLLYRLARSDNVWQRRIAIVTTLHFIRKNEFDDTLKISEILLRDSRDLVHKAVGWMLREVGKRSMAAEETFLKKHCKIMPRTMLRYAIEKFSEKKRRQYLGNGR